MTLFGQRRVTTVKQDDPRPTAKPFEIPKRIVYDAWKRVAANKGAPGVDNESIQAYQENLGGNLYKLWNRMSSGSYHPQLLKQVLISVDRYALHLSTALKATAILSHEK